MKALDAAFEHTPIGGGKRRANSLPRDSISMSRSERRFRAILQAATEVFLQNGYEKTTIDDIVSRAGGSKATVYKHFKTKRELFTAVIDSVVTRGSAEALHIEGPDPASALTAFAKRRIAVVFSPDHIALMRLVTAESERSPEIARSYYQHGPQHSHRILAEYLREQTQQNSLNIDDPDEAAYQFAALLMHRWYLVKLQGGADMPTNSEIDQAVKSVIATFMRLYGVS
jgi:TetR/AcrR family transcriptional repressor of mexJK operon